MAYQKPDYSRFRSKSPYARPDGTPVPGVTTLIGNNLGWSAPGLRNWAVNLAKGGIDPDEYTASRARVGTLLHAMAANHLDRLTHPWPTVGEYAPVEWDEAARRYDAWQQWWNGSGLEPVAIEQSIVAEVAPGMWLGGKPDLFARKADGSMLLLDWKSKLSVITSYAIQLAAYRALYRVNHPDTAIDGAVLCAPNENGSCDVRFLSGPALDEYEEVFHLLLALEGYRKTLKG